MEGGQGTRGPGTGGGAGRGIPEFTQMTRGDFGRLPEGRPSGKTSQIKEQKNVERSQGRGSKDKAE